MSSFQICMLLNNFPDLRPKHLIRNNNLNLVITWQSKLFRHTLLPTSFKHLQFKWNFAKHSPIPAKPQLNWVSLIPSVVPFVLFSICRFPIFLTMCTLEDEVDYRFCNTAFMRAIFQNWSNKIHGGGTFLNIVVKLNHNFKHLQAKRKKMLNFSSDG